MLTRADGLPLLCGFNGRLAAQLLFSSTEWVWASLVAQLGKNPHAMWEIWVPSLGWEDPLEKGKATHSSILAWRIAWTVESMGSQRVWQYWATFTFTSPSLRCLICVHRAPLDLKVSDDIKTEKTHTGNKKLYFYKKSPHVRRVTKEWFKSWFHKLHYN